MLTTIREKTQGWIAGAILGLLAIPFALWGVNSYFESSGKVSVATVDGHDISIDAYHSALEQQRRSLEQMVGHAIDPRAFETPQFKQSVLEGLIDRVLLERDAASQGYGVSDSALAQLIRGVPQFQRDGKFDEQIYENFARDSGYGVAGFEARVRQERIQQQIEGGFVDSAIVTPQDVANVIRLMDEKRVMSYVALKPEQFLGKVTVTPAEIQAHYAAHLDQYRTPERVRIQYVELSAAALGKTISVSEQDLRKAYASNIDRYTVPEQRRASHILIALPGDAGAAAQQKALAEAQDIRAKLLHGANFAELARKYSADTVSAAKGGDLGFVAPGSLDKNFETALFSLHKPGDISEPVHTKFGYHLIKLTAVRPAVTKPFSQVRAEVDDQLRASRAADRFYDVSEKFRDLIFEQSDSLAPAAHAFGLKVMESDWFGRAGGSGITANPKIIAAAFDPDVLGQGHNSHAIDLDADTLAAIRIVAHQDAATKPLAAVRDEIEQQLKMQAAQIQAGLAGAAALKALNQGVSLSVVARQQGSSVTGPVSVTRRQPPTDLAPTVVDSLFAAGQPLAGKPVYGSADLGKDGYVVFALEQVEAGRVADATADVKTQAEHLLADRAGRDYLNNYLSDLRKRAKIKLYPKNL